MQIHFRFREYPRWMQALALMLAIALVIGPLIIFLRPGTAEAAWYNSSWEYRVQLVVNPNKVTGTASTTFLTSGTTWTVPSDWDNASNTIEVIGGGGAGDPASANPGGAGGGGGGYSKITNTTLTPSTNVTYSVGGAAQDSYFCNSTSNCASIAGSAVIVGAKGGTSGDAATGGPGGAAASGVGTVKYSGGDGGTGATVTASGAGGGGAGGPNGNGKRGGDSTTANSSPSAGGGGGGGGAPASNAINATSNGTNGGNNYAGTGGGTGGTTSVAPTAGTAGGGGGGGGDTTSSPGTGATGGAGTEWDATHGSGGGGGGGRIVTQNGGNGGLYGGGGGGGTTEGSGAQGIVVVSYEAQLTNFPVYVDLSDLPQHVWDNMRSDCGDIRITTSDGTTEVPREIVACNNGGQTGEMHFKAPLLSSASNTVFYIYYGNAGQADYAIDATYGAENVWTNGYLGVWHLGEDGNTTAGGYKDSTSNSNDGTGTSMTSDSDITGTVGVAQDFDGSADHILVGQHASLEPTAAITMSLWVRRDGAQATWAKIAWYADNLTSPNGAYGFEFDNTSDTDVRWKLASNSTGYPLTGITLSDATWTYISGTYNGSTLVAYKDGVSVNSDNQTFTIGDYDADGLGIGNRYETGQPFSGAVDELRIINVARSSGWVLTEYNNQNDPSSFYTIGEVPTGPFTRIYTSSDTFVVPDGVTSITVKMWGAGGGGGAGGTSGGGVGGAGGGGGYITGVLSVTPGESLTVTTGLGGSAGAFSTGTGGQNSGDGAGGGGRTELLRSSTRLLVAAGGGGGGGGDNSSTTAGGAGGAGGGTSGVAGSASGSAGGGGAGTDSAGGAGGTGGDGTDGEAGSSLTGGRGAGPTGTNCVNSVWGGGGIAGSPGGGEGGISDDSSASGCAGGGGGGGGHYGGGGGEASHPSNAGGGGGGGGSSYADAGATSVTNTAGSGTTPGNSGDADRGVAGNGGSGGATRDSGTSGSNGKVVITYSVTIASTPETPHFSTAPFNASSAAITMIATTTDSDGNIEQEEGGYFEYYIGYSACGGADDGTGGSDSGWIGTSTAFTYTDSGLQANKCYGYKVSVRDGLVNASATSTASTTYTSAAIPGAPTVTTPSATSLKITNDENGNPTSDPSTLFALQINATSPTDATWDGKYIDAGGNPSDTAVWLSDATWDAMVVQNVDASTQYDIHAKARNEDGDETPFGSTGSATTETPAVGVPVDTRINGGTRLRGGVRL